MLALIRNKVLEKRLTIYHITKKPKILIIAGTRPEAIKVAPLFIECSKRNSLDPVLCSTGQHRELLDDAFAAFNLKPQLDFNIMHKQQTLNGIMKSVIEFSDKAFSDIKPDAVVVQGDTTTAMSVSISAFYRNIPIGHLEAGLRTGNLQSPYPEEANRKIITQIANWNFAPTKQAYQNLLSEGVPPEKIHMVGNSVIDALLLRSQLSQNDPTIATNLKDKLGFLPTEKKIILVTCHRRENFGNPVREILSTLVALANDHEDFHFIYPAHPNPEIQNAIAEIIDIKTKNLHFLNPLNYSEMVYLLEHCFLVLTDSGGIQEEAPTFKKPILILRDTTERPEVLEQGIAKLVGASRKKIMREVNACIKNSDYYNSFIGKSNPFGDGKTSQKVADIIERELLGK